jgi:hypothetical protein
VYQGFVDGGVFANNPSQLAVAKVMEHLHVREPCAEVAVHACAQSCFAAPQARHFGVEHRIWVRPLRVCVREREREKKLNV